MMFLRSRLLACILAVAACAAPRISLAVALPDGVVINNLSSIPITVDGYFTGGVTGGVINPGTEWSDVTPVAFISPPTAAGTLLRTTVGDPNANSLLYAVIAPGSSAPAATNELYLMYDNATRTSTSFTVGEELARIVFPISFQGNPNLSNLAVIFKASSSGTAMLEDADGDGSASPIASFFDVFTELDGNPGPPADFLGIEGAIGFGPSALGSNPHMLIELEAALLIPDGFGPGFPGGSPGENGNGYSPLPAFWGASGKNDGTDPPLSAALFTINPDASVRIDASAVPTELSVPEPATAMLLGLGLVGLAGARRLRNLKKR